MTIEFETGIRVWINAWNANLKPFIWTKTADDILDSLAVTANELRP